MWYFVVHNNCRALANLQSASALLAKQLFHCGRFNRHFFTPSNVRKIDNPFTLASIIRGRNSYKLSTWLSQQQIRRGTNSTAVKNNVILFKHDSLTKIHNRYMFVAIAQMIPWFAIAYMQYQFCNSTAHASTSSWPDYMVQVVLPMGIFCFALCAGPAVYLVMSLKAKRSVKSVILKSGGKEAIFTTYHPLNKHSAITVPLERVSCLLGRRDMVSYMPIKIEGKLFHYILDSNGKFLNPELFDYTVGQRRVFK